MTGKAKNSILKVSTIAGYRVDKYLQKECLTEDYHFKQEPTDTMKKLSEAQVLLDYVLDILHSIKTE